MNKSIGIICGFIIACFWPIFALTDYGYLKHRNVARAQKLLLTSWVGLADLLVLIIGAIVYSWITLLLGSIVYIFSFIQAVKYST